jgi:hypothetical protein
MRRIDPRSCGLGNGHEMHAHSNLFRGIRVIRVNARLLYRRIFFIFYIYKMRNIPDHPDDPDQFNDNGHQSSPGARPTPDGRIGISRAPTRRATPSPRRTPSAPAPAARSGSRALYRWDDERYPIS